MIFQKQPNLAYTDLRGKQKKVGKVIAQEKEFVMPNKYINNLNLELNKVEFRILVCPASCQYMQPKKKMSSSSIQTILLVTLTC